MTTKNSNSIHNSSTDKLHNNLSVLQKLQVSGGSLNEHHWYDGLSSQIADFLTSVLLIMIVMIAFLCGIAIHIKAVFDSWFLAVGFQSVVLLTSVNSDLLPKYKQLPVIAICMSILTCIFVFLSFDGHLSTGIMLVVNIIKAVAVAGVEFIFAYLFCARNNRTKAEKSGYRFDLEGNVVMTPFDAIHNNLTDDTKQEDDTKKEADTPIAVEHIVDNAQSTDKPIQQNNVSDNNAFEESAFFKHCECGAQFNDKLSYDKHVESCDVHKWFIAGK